MFRCTAYIHVPKDEREKLDLKTKKCVLLGYSVQKGLRYILLRIFKFLNDGDNSYGFQRSWGKFVRL